MVNIYLTELIVTIIEAPGKKGLIKESNQREDFEFEHFYSYKN